ncbi:MAG TPA: LCP family protein [Aeromicrobium sp.]|nr:LCP family protein [Aeromicrobium sp.]
MSDDRSKGDYDWLFDANAKTAPRPKSPTPRPSAPPTAHIPSGATSPPPSSPASTLPPPSLPPPKKPVKAKSSSTRKFQLPKWWRLSTGATLAAIPVVWIIYLAVVPVMAWSSVSTLQAWPDGNRPAEQPGTTYLVVGSDSRKGLTEEQQKDLKTGKESDIGGGRTDTIMMLHTGAGKPTLVSIPRDSIVAIPGYYTTKINAAYAFGGPELLVQTLEESTGVRIDRYVEIGFGGVVSLVDAVGGVEICPEEDMDDDKAGLDVKKGCQEVDGKTALGYSRTRKFASGDIQRVQNQREVIGGLGRKLRSPMTVIDPIRYFRVVTGGTSAISVDDTASIPDMARFALALSGAMGANGRNCNVPISDLAVHWDVNRAPAFFEHIRTDTADDLDDLCTKDGLPPS